MKVRVPVKKPAAPAAVKIKATQALTRPTNAGLDAAALVKKEHALNMRALDDARAAHIKKLEEMTLPVIHSRFDAAVSRAENTAREFLTKELYTRVEQWVEQLMRKRSEIMFLPYADCSLAKFKPLFAQGWMVLDIVTPTVADALHRPAGATLQRPFSGKAITLPAATTKPAVKIKVKIGGK